MTPYELCCKYLGLKKHFTEDKYDFFLKGGVPIKLATFQKRPDKMHFEKVAKHRDPIGLIVANFIQTGKFPWIGDMEDRHYLEWQKNLQSLTYNLTNDLTRLDKPFIINLKVKENTHPPIMKAMLSGSISIETFCIVVELTDTLSYFDKKFPDDLMWRKLRFIYTKYLPFIRLRYDRSKVLEIFKDLVEI
jgi:hypothetical protein